MRHASSTGPSIGLFFGGQTVAIGCAFPVRVALEQDRLPPGRTGVNRFFVRDIGGITLRNP